MHRCNKILIWRKNHAWRISPPPLLTFT